jgi:hypothetical protein
MKTYEVEMKYEAYVIVTVDADNEDDAEVLAMEHLEGGNGVAVRDGQWSLESIEELA